MAYADPADQKAAAQRHYQANRAVVIERAAKAKRETVRQVSEFLRGLKSKPCLECGVSYPWYVMQFDHVRGEKSFNLGDRRKWTSMARVQAEVIKCEVVCANCHAERTYQRLVAG